jgi:glycosyltransferase involved in cell wall biosynthesis
MFSFVPMKILHVMTEFPYPPDAGIRGDIWSRVRTLHRLGHSIDAIVMQQKLIPETQHVAKMRQIVNSLSFVERQPLRTSLATTIPTMVALNKTLASLQLRERYDITLVESERVYSIFDNPTLQTKIRAVRVHNNESRYMWVSGRTEEAFLRRQFCRFEALRFVPFSRSVYRRVDSLWFISKSELQKFTASNPMSAAKAVWLPPSIVFRDEPQPSRSGSKRVLWVASLNNTLNREGLRWYFKHVHPRLIEHPNYELVVAGSTSGRACAYRFVNELKQQRHCSVHVDVDDLTALYNRCAVFINPMQRGTGVKLKNIHAIERRVPVVTTSVGNDGSGFADKRDVRVADTPAAFASAVRELLEDECLGAEMAARAYDHLANHYNSETNLQQLLTTLQAADRSQGKPDCPRHESTSGDRSILAVTNSRQSPHNIT